jgi:colanic acid/amylovoran biosynthesis glycosyltransferase
MIRVLHIVPTWLQQTQNWIHTQVDCTPVDCVESHVGCERVANLGQFAVTNLHSLSAQPWIRRAWDLGCRRLRLRRHLDFYARLARFIEADIVHSHFGHVGWTNLGAVRAAGTRHVVTFYGFDVNYLPRRPRWGGRIRDLLEKADLVLCEGPHMRDCIEALGCPAGKTRVQHLGVRLERLPFQPRAMAAGEPLRVLMAAAFVEKKGIPYGLRALGRLKRHVNLEATVIGDARNAPDSRQEKARIQDAIRESGLEGKVAMLGLVPYAELLRQMALHHVFLAPSVTSARGDTEGGAPVSIIEAAASGMVVVSSRHCDIPNVVIDRETGFLADERDIDGLAECLAEAVAMREHWSGMLQLARARVEAKFTAARQGEHLAAIYRELISRA